jgi:uncharacterized protein YraI
LKQAPHAWYQRFATYLATLGFHASDTSLFVLRSGGNTAYLLLYVVTSLSRPHPLSFCNSFFTGCTVSLL